MLIELSVGIVMVTAGACSHPLTSRKPVAQVLSGLDADGHEQIDRGGERTTRGDHRDLPSQHWDWSALKEREALDSPSPAHNAFRTSISQCSTHSLG